MNRIDLKFKELKEKNEKALIPFIALGDKSLDETVEIAQVLEKAGAILWNLEYLLVIHLLMDQLYKMHIIGHLTSGINI